MLHRCYKRHFSKGDAAFYRGDYLEAREYWRAGLRQASLRDDAFALELMMISWNLNAIGMHHEAEEFANEAFGVAVQKPD